MLVERNKEGKLVIKSLDLQIFLGDLFDICETEEEVEFILSNIQECAECTAEETIEEKGL